MFVSDSVLSGEGRHLHECVFVTHDGPWSCPFTCVRFSNGLCTSVLSIERVPDAGNGSRAQRTGGRRWKSRHLGVLSGRGRGGTWRPSSGRVTFLLGLVRPFKLTRVVMAKYLRSSPKARIIALKRGPGTIVMPCCCHSHANFRCCRFLMRRWSVSS